jgi:hypothetical protein
MPSFELIGTFGAKLEIYVYDLCNPLLQETQPGIRAQLTFQLYPGGGSEELRPEESSNPTEVGSEHFSRCFDSRFREKQCFLTAMAAAAADRGQYSNAIHIDALYTTIP